MLPRKTNHHGLLQCPIICTPIEDPHSWRDSPNQEVIWGIHPEGRSKDNTLWWRKYNISKQCIHAVCKRWEIDNIFLWSQLPFTKMLNRKKGLGICRSKNARRYTTPRQDGQIPQKYPYRRMNLGRPTIYKKDDMESNMEQTLSSD